MSEQKNIEDILSNLDRLLETGAEAGSTESGVPLPEDPAESHLSPTPVIVPEPAISRPQAGAVPVHQSDESEEIGERPRILLTADMLIQEHGEQR